MHSLQREEWKEGEGRGEEGKGGDKRRRGAIRNSIH